MPCNAATMWITFIIQLQCYAVQCWLILPILGFPRYNDNSFCLSMVASQIFIVPSYASSMLIELHVFNVFHKCIILLAF